MAGLLEFLRVNPKTVENTVFKYLTYETGPHELAKVKHKGLIACTSRTGSSLLQVSLERYGLNAQEFFNPEGPPRRAFERKEALSIRDFANFLAQTAVRRDWFIAKGALNSLLYLYYLDEVPERSVNWKFIFLRRRNVVRQAISMSVATATDQWTGKMPAKGEIRMSDYCFEKLCTNIESICVQNDKWERAFGFLGIEPYRLFYEDFISDLVQQTELIAKFLGVDVGAFPNAQQHVPWLESQSTDLNVEWERRFRQEFTAQVAERRSR